MSITLPTEMADLLRAKVACGQYATESEVIREGLRVLIARDRIQEKWLQDEVVSGGEMGSSGERKLPKKQPAGAAPRRNRPRKAAAATQAPAAAAPLPAEPDAPHRSPPEPPNFDFGRMQVVLKDAPG